MKYLSALSLLSAFLVFSSCSEDEVPSGNVYVLNLPQEYEGIQTTAAISGESGEIFDTGNAKAGSTLKLYAPKDYMGVVHFHYIIRVKNSDTRYQFSLYTISNVTAGFEYTPGVGKLIERERIHMVDVQDIPNDYTLMRHVGETVQPKSSYVLTDPLGGSQVFSSQLSSGSITYILQKVNNGSPRYLHFSEPEEGWTYEANFTDFIPAEEVNLNIGEQADEITVSMSALYPETQNISLGGYSSTNTDNINFFDYPESIIPNTLTVVQVEQDNVIHTYRKYGARITEMNWLDGDISSLTFSGNSINITATGEYTSMSARSNENWSIDDIDYSLMWQIQFNESNSVALPDIMNTLSKRWPELKDAPVNFDYVSITKSSVENNTGESISLEKSF